MQCPTKKRRGNPKRFWHLHKWKTSETVFRQWKHEREGKESNRSECGDAFKVSGHAHEMAKGGKVKARRCRLRPSQSRSKICQIYRPFGNSYAEMLPILWLQWQKGARKGCPWVCIVYSASSYWIQSPRRQSAMCLLFLDTRTLAHTLTLTLSHTHLVGAWHIYCGTRANCKYRSQCQ